ncbi:hypothetical protein EGI22_22935 [Lacihabitans sp. LS3-19]|uniref:hypothetical protein n=1 Tax=Lacihabitans sp. LS3-19 TaxID=2487335 RepID=UPI0020CFAB51|nr:hypothetical protein [Lacihabitans sp. LS3-19]MCP9770770.1 hypothetical protein [Lacihabitans sp. LS3-19]
MKKLIAILVLLPFGLIAQNAEITNQSISTIKVVADSIVRNTDSVYISKIKSPAGRITSLKTSTLNANVISGVQSNIATGTFTSLFVNASSQLQNFSGNIGSVNELVISSSISANPVFTDENGKVTKESKSQFMSIPAVAFTPENISPLESISSSLVVGGIRRFVNNGEVEGQSLANDHLFKLVAPLVFPLNNADQNISFVNARMCTYDKENSRDLAAVVYEVNSSVGQFPLVVNPKMVFRSANNNATYQCFDLKEGFGSAFPIDAANNSYYVGVFPVLASIKSDEILQDPDTYITPWRAEDNPFLRLVHFIVEYKFQ